MLQFSASSSIIIIEDYYLQTFLHSLALMEENVTCVQPLLIWPQNNPLIHCPLKKHILIATTTTIRIQKIPIINLAICSFIIITLKVISIVYSIAICSSPGTLGDLMIS